MNDDGEQRKRGLFGELSLLTVLATVFASVTSAYVASSLGVSGTLIGAGIASFVSSIAATLYSSGLRRSTELAGARRGRSSTARGRPDPHDERSEDLGGPPGSRPPSVGTRDATNEKFGASVLATLKAHWKSIVGTSVAVLVLTVAIIISWEATTGRGFGAGDDKVVTVFSDTPQPRKEPADTEPTPDPSDSPAPARSPKSTAPAPEPSEPAPEPTQSVPSESTEPPPTE